MSTPVIDRNSARSRVTPIFDALYAEHGDDPGLLSKLLALPHRFDGTDTQPIGDGGELVAHRWAGVAGGGELQLAPPRSLLSWLVAHPEALTQPKPLSDDPSPTEQRRRDLLAGDADAQAEAQQSLAATTLPRGAWYIFEGPTSVDVFLETADMIAVIEGKRTESGPTLKTDWMAVRHQLLRNIDAALEIVGDRRVVGALIVEAEPGGVDVPLKWQAMTDLTISPAALSKSLPHRSPAERERIAAGYLGATTWTAVVREFGLDENLVAV